MKTGHQKLALSILQVAAGLCLAGCLGGNEAASLDDGVDGVDAQRSELARAGKGTKLKAVSIAITCTRGDLEVTMLTAASATTGEAEGVEVEFRHTRTNATYIFDVLRDIVRTRGPKDSATYRLAAKRSGAFVTIDGLDTGNPAEVAVTATSRTRTETFPKGSCARAR